MTRRVAAWVLTALAGLLVLFALLLPNRTGGLSAGAFLRIPVEALVGVALVLVLPAQARRVFVVLVGVGLGLLTVMKVIDMGFYQALDRSFDPVLDWPLLADFVGFLTRSMGRTGSTVAVVAAIVAAIALPILLTLSVRRLSRLLVERRTPVARTVVALGVAWVALAVLGVPVASGSAASLTYDHLRDAYGSLQDRRAFAAESSVDAFRETPGEKLLTGLRGKDVVLAFVESYGRVAIEDPELGPQVGALLDDGNRRLKAAGFASRSAYLTSSTAGGASWLAHGSLLSGLWIDNQQRHHDLEAGDRLTLIGAHRRAGWRTVGVLPGVDKPWPEAAFYRYDQLYTSLNMGYRGPVFTFASLPDQYTLAAFHRAERAAPGHAPVMAEIVLMSSHSPWTPVPRLVGWDEIGDGTVYKGMPETAEPAESVVRSRSKTREAYRQSIEYSLDSLISYVETYGDDNLVLVFLGDHQPSPFVTGDGASRDVPITIVARDRAVLDRISGWGWQDGLKPGPQAPVWRMDAFRDRYLTAFGP